MRKASLAGVLTAMIATVGMASPGWAQLSDAPWPKFQRDLGNTGRSPLPGPATMAQKWVFTAPTWIKTQVSVSRDGYLYFAHSKEVVCKLDEATGTVLACGGLGGFANTSSPAIGNGTTATSADYKIYRGERNNKFWSYDPDVSVVDGEMIITPSDPYPRVQPANSDPIWYEPGWPYKIPYDGDVFSSPSITPDGTIYTACGCLSAGLIHAFKADGSQKWPPFKVGLSGIRNSSPAIVLEGSNIAIFIGSVDGYLSRIDDTVGATASPADEAWRQRHGTSMKNSSPSVENGNVYIGSNDGLASYFATTGGLRWKVLTEEGEFDTTPAIGAVQAGGWRYIYASAFKNGKRTVYRVKDDGSANPQVTMLATGVSTQTASFTQSPSPVIDGNGNVYAAVGRAALRFDGITGALTGQFPTEDYVISLSLGNGVLYVTDRNNHLYAVGN